MSQLVQAAAAEAGLRHEQQHARAADDARRQARRRKVNLLLLGVLAPVLALLIVLNLSGTWLVFGTRAPSAAEQHRRALADASFVVEAIDAYRAQRGTLPATLAAVDVRNLHKWSYEVTADGRYRLSYTAYGETVSYDSSQDADAFFAGVRRATGKDRQ
jgi:hypothetical protein